MISANLVPPVAGFPGSCSCIGTPPVQCKENARRVCWFRPRRRAAISVPDQFAADDLAEQLPALALELHQLQKKSPAMLSQGNGGLRASAPA
jgi:hypothetical protein